MVRSVRCSRTASTAVSGESAAPKKGTSTGTPPNERTMPVISGQWGARSSTSSPGFTIAPATAPRAPVAPVATRTLSRPVGTPLRVRTRSTMASSSAGIPCGEA